MARDVRTLTGLLRQTQPASRTVERLVDLLERGGGLREVAADLDVVNERVIRQRDECRLRRGKLRECLGRAAEGGAGDAAECTSAGRQQIRVTPTRFVQYLRCDLVHLRELSAPVVIERQLERQVERHHAVVVEFLERPDDEVPRLERSTTHPSGERGPGHEPTSLGDSLRVEQCRGLGEDLERHLVGTSEQCRA